MPYLPEMERWTVEAEAKERHASNVCVQAEAEAEAGSGFGEDHGVFRTAPLKADRRRLTQADCRRERKTGDG